ncbi:MAG: DUF2149 domain-containing protein [Actinobacteria bacterium]|nr:DUF2149 domain-containing protein [Actinomycetota bacterium]
MSATPARSAASPRPRRRIFVTPNARRAGDRAGDPLEGLVNLFDLGIVLAVAFLLAALASLKLSSLLTSNDVTVVKKGDQQDAVIVKRGEKVKTIELSHAHAVGKGEPIGRAYRLADGRVVVVTKPR